MTRKGVVARAGLVLLGTIASLALLAAIEAALRLFGLGAERQHDPLVGFSSLVPAFTLVEREDGSRVYRSAEARHPAEFLAEKPAGSFRIFTVGGSSAHGVPYTPDESFAHQLDLRLAAEIPEVEVEVVNAAVSGYGSQRVLIRVREIARHEPDLLVVYSAHNEVAERRFHARLIDRDPRLFRLQEWLVSSRLYAVTAPLFDRPAAPAPARLEAGGEGRELQMFAIPKAPHRDLDAIEERFRANIGRMIDAIHEVGGRVMIVAPSQNFADWEPGASFHRADLTHAERAEWDARVERGDRLSRRNCTAALVAWQQALAIDDAFAALHFKIGGCQRELSQFAAARESYWRASDLDGVPLGAPTRYAALLRQVAREHGALFVDIDALFAEESPHGLVGRHFFVDAVHPNLRAHQRIAEAVAEALSSAGIPVPPERWRRGAYADPDVETLHAARPELRRQESLIRAMGCLLVERRSCVAREAEAILAADPDDPIALQLLESSRPPGRPRGPRKRPDAS